MRNSALRYLLLCFLGLVAFGCNSTDTVEPHPIPQNYPTPFPGFTFPLVDLTGGRIPLPNNLLRNPVTGKLNLPLAPGADPNVDSTVTAANSLDGFSTTAPILVPFRGTVIPESVTAATLPVFDEDGDAVLATYSVAENETGSVVTIVPVRPLDSATTYTVVLTQGIISKLSGTPILSDNVIGFLQRTTPLVDGDGNSITLGLSNEQAQTLEPIRQANQAVIADAEDFTETSRANIPFAFAFTTQTLFSALPVARAEVLADNAPLVNRNPAVPTLPIAQGQGFVGGPLPTVDEFWTTLPAAAQAAPNDSIGRIFLGSVAVPQFRANQLEDFWAQPPVAGASTNVPFLLFMPDATAFPGPRPVTIFQHGITRSKGDSFVLANAFNSQGIALIAIDLPLHGDLKAPGATSDGEGFINPAKPRVSRDNIRQGVVGLYALNNAINLGLTDLTGDSVPELAPGSAVKPFFIGQSLGSIVGTTYLATEPNANRGVLSVPGGRIINLLLTSPAFGPPIKAGLAANGVVEGTADFARFILFTQAVLDDVDPLNYAEPAITGTLRGGTGANLLQQVHLADQVILPAAQYDLANAFGENANFAQVAAINPLALVTQVLSPDPGPGMFEVAAAGHGALLNPADGPTVGIVTQAITFIGTGNIASGALRAQQAPFVPAVEDLEVYRKAVSF